MPKKQQQKYRNFGMTKNIACLGGKRVSSDPLHPPSLAVCSASARRLTARARLIILRFMADIKAKKSSRDHFQPRMGWRKGPLRGVAAEIMV